MRAAACRFRDLTSRGAGGFLLPRASRSIRCILLTEMDMRERILAELRGELLQVQEAIRTLEVLAKRRPRPTPVTPLVNAAALALPSESRTRSASAIGSARGQRPRSSSSYAASGVNVERILAELRRDRRLIEEAMRAQNRRDAQQGRRRGRPPAWMSVPPTDPSPTTPAARALPRDWRTRRVCAVGNKLA